MKRRGLLGVVAVVGLAGAAATALALQRDGGSSVPTEAQARAALETKFQQAQAGDPRVYCADTRSPEMCESQWERLGGRPAVPRALPKIASTREQDGYRVLRVCGIDGRGQLYRTDFVVALEERKLTPVFPVFWNGATFSGVHGDDARPKGEAGRTDSAGSCS